MCFWFIVFGLSYSVYRIRFIASGFKQHIRGVYICRKCENGCHVSIKRFDDCTIVSRQNTIVYSYFILRLHDGLKQSVCIVPLVSYGVDTGDVENDSEDDESEAVE